MQQTNFSRSLTSVAEQVATSPKPWKTSMESGNFSSTFNGVNLPFRTKALTVSHPVKQCNAGRSEHKSDPFTSTICLTFNSLRLLPVPVSNKTNGCIFCAYFNRRTNTSVSGERTMIWVVVGVVWEICIQWRIILVSASSCELKRVLTAVTETVSPVGNRQAVTFSCNSEVNFPT